MHIVTGWTGEYWNDPKVRVRCLENIQSYIDAYGCRVGLYTTPTCFRQMVELGFPDFDLQVGIYIVPDEPLLTEAGYYDWIRFKAFTYQKERFIWIDPDIKALKPYPNEVLEDEGTVYFQDDWADNNNLIYNKSQLHAALSAEQAQEYALRYENTQNILHYLVYETLIFDAKSAYIFGTEILKIMRQTATYNMEMHPRRLHAIITENFGGHIFDAFQIPVKFLNRLYTREEYVQYISLDSIDLQKTLV